ncbi:MAG: hypothetical protein COA78_06510 [Blastopirellula sp.]|nr:MAG: hypothetical protein COA78_06510 [Blastopirellula sp.]
MKSILNTIRKVLKFRLFSFSSTSNSLTKEWGESYCYRILLRNDILLRFATLVSVLLFATGILALGVSFIPLKNHAVNSSLLIIPFFLGPLLGLMFGGFSIFFGQENTGGKLWLRDDYIYRSRSYIDFGESWTVEERWPYDSIDKCEVIPDKTIDQWFSLLVLEFDSDKIDIIAVPDDLDLLKIAKFIQAKGVNVSQGKEIPPQFTEKINKIFPIVFASIGIPFILIGLLLTNARVNDAADHLADNKDQDPIQPIQQQIVKRGQDALPRKEDINQQQAIPGAPVYREPSIRPPSFVPRSTRPSGFSPPSTTSSKSKTTSSRPQEKRPSSTPGVDSAMAGGEGGEVFYWYVNSNSQPVVGIKYSMGSWAGKMALREFEPFFGRSGNSASHLVMARDGYALGGVNVNSTEFVHAVRLLFMKIKPDGSLDSSDQYISDWLGTPVGNSSKSILGNGKKVIGIKCCKGAVIDSMGLVFGE